MPQNRIASSGAASINVSLDDLLDDLDLEAADEEEVIEVVEDPADFEDLDLGATTETVELDEADIEALEIRLDITDNYAEQQADAADPDIDPATIAPKKTRKVKAAGTATPRAPGKPRAERDLSKIAPEFFVLEGSIADAAAGADDKVRDDVIALKPSQKKIAEKFENTFVAIAAGRKPSTFVVDALALLDSSGSISNAALVAAYSADDYDIGTARSQAGQIIKLFTVLKIGVPAGKNTLNKNPNSTVAERIRQIVGGAAA